MICFPSCFYSAFSFSCAPVAHWDAFGRHSSRCISWYQIQLILSMCHVHYRITLCDNGSIGQLRSLIRRDFSSEHGEQALPARRGWHPPPPRALLERRGQGGRGSRGGGPGGEGGRGSREGERGVQGGAPPRLAEMNHIHQELQNCTTLTHSAYTFVIMSEDK